MAKLSKEEFVRVLQESLQYPYSSNAGDLVEIGICKELTGEARKWYGNGKADVNGYSVKALLFSDYAINSNVAREDLSLTLDEIIAKYAFDDTVTGVIVVEDAQAFLDNRAYTELTREQYIEHVRNRIYFSNRSTANKHNIMLKVGKKIRTEEEIRATIAKAISVKYGN